MLSIVPMEEEISSLGQFVDSITKKFRLIKVSGLKKDYMFFRGQPDAEFPLLPSIAREVKNSGESLLRLEAEMIQSAKLQAADEFANVKYPVNLLAKMQHYGMPTRLLDLSRNALVGLYFACERYEKKDGKVFCFKVKQGSVKNCYDVSPNIIAATYLMNQESDILKIIKTIKYEPFFPRRLRDRVDQSLINAFHKSMSKPFFVLPELETEREKRQQAAFIIFPNDLDDTGQTINEVKILSTISEYCDDISYVYKIPRIKRNPS
jgi:hypothetical protein